MPTRSPKELKDDIDRAVQILQLFTDPSKGRDVRMLIPKSILRDAHGIVFIRLYRIGFMLSAKSGTGVIIARLPDGSWSAPSAVSMNSVGFGHQAGAEVIDSIIVMNYRAAVKAFFDGGGQLQLGVGASLAVGPMGRAADVAASASKPTHIAATYAYCASKGLYIGYHFEGSKISERVNTNAAYYGRPISAREILTGMVPPPQDGAPLYDTLNAMGAGPRPGLPFAPQKDKAQQFSEGGGGGGGGSMPPLQHSYTAPPTTSQQGPPVNYANRPPTTADGFEEPPPPYDGPPPPPTSSSSAPVSPAATSSSYNSPYASYNSTPYVGDHKAPISNPYETQYSNSYSYRNQPPSTNNNYASQQPRTTNDNNNGKTPLSSVSRGAIHNEAIAVQRTGSRSTANNNYFAGASSSASSSSVTPVSILNNNSSFAQPAQQPQASTDIKKPLPDRPSHQQELTVVIAKYDYTSDNPNDLSFSAGDTIIVTKRLEDRQAWWEGEIGTKRGFFPANYTEELSDD